VIDDDLMHSALLASGAKTKKEAVEKGLRLLVRVSAQKEIARFRGKLHWDGDLHKSRLD